jgi:hypothetical protein
MATDREAGPLQAAGSGEGDSVCVALHVRPLSPSEVDQGCRNSLSVAPGAPQASAL